MQKFFRLFGIITKHATTSAAFHLYEDLLLFPRRTEKMRSYGKIFPDLGGISVEFKVRFRPGEKVLSHVNSCPSLSGEAI